MSIPKGEPVPFAVGDVLRLKKPHPCGGYEWTVVRLGADIGLRCQSCGRRVLLPRRELERRLKLFVSRSPDLDRRLATNDEPSPEAAPLETDQ